MIIIIRWHINITLKQWTNASVNGMAMPVILGSPVIAAFILKIFTI